MASRRLKVAAAVGAAYTTADVLVIVLARRGVISPQLALLLLVALTGLFFGFGVLVAVYRLVTTLK